MEKRIFYYQKINSGQVRLLRCFGESPRAVVPENIEGMAVTEIGPYCFARNSHLDRQKYEKTACICDEKNGKTFSTTDETSTSETEVAEQAGLDLLSVVLPSSVRKIDAYAFYGCRKLEELSIGGGVEELGSDAFMNCTALHSLILRAHIWQKTVLNLFLAQITWTVEVSWISDTDSAEANAFDEADVLDKNRALAKKNISKQNDSPEARFLFPEYLEYYEELGPAHVFELQVEGEGFRARKAFAEGIFLPAEYDGIFPKACAEEKEEDLCRMAEARLMYPVGLKDDSRELYREYLKKHQQTAAHVICFPKQGERRADYLDRIEFLLKEKILEKEAADQLARTAAEKEMPEMAAAMIRFRRTYFAPQDRKKRYSFDDF